MSALLTTVRRDFAGRERNFRLRIGEIGELERLCGAGIGAIAMRLAGHQFYAADIWETIRLGLEGGGASEIEASALTRRYRDEPITTYLSLAVDIVMAAVSGVAPEGKAKRRGKRRPETSPPSTGPAA